MDGWVDVCFSIMLERLNGGANCSINLMTRERSEVEPIGLRALRGMADIVNFKIQGCSKEKKRKALLA